MKQNDGFSVALQRTKTPPAKHHTIGGGGGHLLQIDVQCASVIAHGGEFVLGQWPPSRMQRAIGEIKTADGAKTGIQE